MWIQVREEDRDWFGTESFSDEEGTLGHAVELTANYTANVPENVGEQVIDHYPWFERASSDSDGEEDADDG